MKIYPSSDTLKLTQEVNLTTQIPLAFIDYATTDYDIQFTPCISSAAITPILPYETFSDYNYKFFATTHKGSLNPNDYTEVDNTEYLVRVGDSYQYIPHSNTSFLPLTFDYALIGQKKLDYKTDRIYNMRIGCIEKDTTYSEALIKVFANAPEKGICPPNIWINNKDLALSSLTTGTFEEKDFLFISSKTGQTYCANNEPIDYEKFLEAHINIWLMVEDLPALLNNSASYLRPALYKNVTCHNNVFETTSFNRNYLPEGGNTITLFTQSGTKTPIFIQSYKNKSFIIVSTADFVKQSTSNYAAIYETLYYVYSHAYVETHTITQWITDTMPDYVVKNGELTVQNAFRTPKPYYCLLGFQNASEVNLSKIVIDSPYVFVKSISNDYIIFEKADNANLKDPEKPKDTIAIYTEHQEIIFIDRFLYKIEENIADKVKFKKTDTAYLLSFDYFKHSSAGINVTSAPIYGATIPLVETVNYKEQPVECATYILYAANNMFLIAKEEDFDNAHFTKLAIIQVTRRATDLALYDMRTRGGGLPKKYPDDLNLLDIGLLRGRAYRKGGTLIFRLPKRLKSYDTIIQETIKQHLIAERYILISYE